MTNQSPASTARRMRQVAAAALWLACLPALAHVPDGSAGSGFASGFVHPIQGWDHLLAMVCVGLWGAILGRPLVLALPVVFPLLMLVGAAMGMAGVPIPATEPGIAVSMLALGLAVAFDWRAPWRAALAMVAVFGIFHGHAHGVELPRAADPAAYATGFVLATGLLHAAGIAIGALRANAAGRRAVCALGAGIAAGGLWLIGAPLLSA